MGHTGIMGNKGNKGNKKNMGNRQEGWKGLEMGWKEVGKRAGKRLETGWKRAGNLLEKGRKGVAKKA
jgi:hypothetical protein